jgi:uncharacterized protein (DUF885 family)
MKKTKKKLLFLILSLLIVLSGCFGNQRRKFDSFMEQLFINMVGSPLDANFLVKDAKAFGFEDLKVEPITFSEEDYQDYYQVMKTLKEELVSFRYENLDPGRQLTYRVVEDYLEINLSYEDYYYYENPLGSYLGYQAQLPLVLSEYHFYTMKDIEDYFDYLITTRTSFENIIAFENEKSERGFGMNDKQIDGIISQCESFLSAEVNYLIPLFNKKVEGLQFLSLDEKNLYRTHNEDLIKNEFLPAYRYLKKELAKLKGRAVNNQGLAHFEKGKEYYQVLFRDATGTKLEVAEAYTYLEEKFEDNFDLFTTLFKQPGVAYKVMSLDSQFSNYTNQGILDFYLENYQDDFPIITDVKVKIENIPSSLKENSSPAMYFLSPIDAEVTEVIYINDSIFGDRPAYAFFTLAHEGVPGHLLQHSILKNSSLPNIRKFISYKSYSEAWATYVERFVGEYTEIDSNVLKAYQLNDELTYLYFCMADIGINYYGWSIPKFTEFIRDMFQQLDSKAIEEIYYQLIEIATNYLEYFFSYHQLLDLKASFIEKSKDLDIGNINYEFHNFYLNTGPTPFYILEEEIALYLKRF